MSYYQFNIEHQTGEPTEYEYSYHRNDSAARSRAATLAKQNDCPVDLAYEGTDEWNDRYITTAMPSDVHAKGVRFERLDG